MEQNGGSSSAAGFQYDVFLSFRGEDTRHTFTRDLYNALRDHGIRTFRDTEELKTGERIPDLMHKIEVSEVFVAVISENYADSKWCLREIKKMVDCGRWIIPVFYRVEVGHVKNLQGKFGEDFIEHEKADDLDRSEIELWKAALKAVGQKIGHVVKDSEVSYINKIVNEVSQRVKIHGYIGYSVGFNERVDEITQLLALEDNGNVRIVCLYGMDGIGKTRLAEAVCNRISGNFEACSFLDKIKEKDLRSCQMGLLEDILGCREDVSRVSKGITLLRKRLPCKKALIILDDVNQKGQMDALAGDPGWFGPGSRIIITTSNLEMTTYHEPKSQPQTRKWLHNVYEVKKLNDKHSLELLSYHAFKGNQSEPGYEDLLKDVVSYACNLPLALEILGGLLSQRDKSSWEESFDDWKKSIPGEINKILELSYRELQDEHHQSIFLDIACLFIGVNKEIARHIWQNGIDAIIALSNRCLIKINHEKKLEMHDLIRKMGIELVRQEKEYSRLWSHDDVMKASRNEENLRLVKGINLMNDVGQQSTATRLENLRLPNLEVLRFKGNSFSSGLIPHLKWMEWHACPLESLSSLKLEEAVVLDLSHGKIIRPWKPSRKESQVFTKLKVLNLTGCGQLRSTEGLSTFPEMKLLIVEGCSKLEEVHPSIEKLNELALLNMKDCCKLAKLPDCFSNLKSLKTINFSNCCELQNVPDSICYLPVLRELLLAGCSKLRCLPDSFGLNILETINLSNCSCLEKLPDSICKVPSVRKLLLAGCSRLKCLPDALGCLKNLEILVVDHCKALEKLPHSIGGLRSLQILHLKGTSFAELPDSMCALISLRELDMTESKLRRLPAAIVNCRNLTILVLDKSDIEEMPDSIDLLGGLVKCSKEGCSRLKF